MKSLTLKKTTCLGTFPMSHSPRPTRVVHLLLNSQAYTFKDRTWILRLQCPVQKNAHLQKSKMHLPSKDLFSSTKQYQDGGTLPSEWFPFAYLHFEPPGGRVGSPRRHMRSGTLNLELTISAEAFQISLRYNGIAIHKFNLYIFFFVSQKNTNSSKGKRSIWPGSP